MPVHRLSSRPLRRRSAVALALVIGAVGVGAAHGLPAIGHNGTGHDGIAVGHLAAVCLAVTATAAAALSRPGILDANAPELLLACRAANAAAGASGEGAGPTVSPVLRL